MKKQIIPAINAPLFRGAFVLLPLALAFCAIQFSLGQRSEKEGFQEDSAVREAAREAWERLRLQDEHGQIPPNALRRALEQKKAMPFRPEAWTELLPRTEGIRPEQAEQLIWTSIGPGNIGGRIRSIIVHPTVPSTIWLGAVGGGVWKTTNGGTSWSTVTDSLANIAVNCMAIDPTNSNILYAGTGEGFFPADEIQGYGIFKTTDGGNTWTQLSSTANNQNFHWVNRIALSPPGGGGTRPILAATQFGIFRSQDNGANWSQALSTLGVLDVLFQPNDRNKCIAGTRDGAAYYSLDGGQTWNLATRSWPSPTPPDSRRVELAYSRNNPSIVYALVE